MGVGGIIVTQLSHTETEDGKKDMTNQNTLPQTVFTFFSSKISVNDLK